MSEHTEDQHAISVSELDQEVLELGLLAHLLACPESLFMYAALNIRPDFFEDPVAARVYAGIVQGIISSRKHGASIPVDNLNFADTDALAIDLLRRAVAGGYPCVHSLAPYLIELHDRHMLAQLEVEAGLDESWEQISQEFVPDKDSEEMPW